MTTSSIDEHIALAKGNIAKVHNEMLNEQAMAWAQMSIAQSLIAIAEQLKKLMEPRSQK